MPKRSAREPERSIASIARVAWLALILFGASALLGGGPAAAPMPVATSPDSGAVPPVAPSLKVSSVSVTGLESVDTLRVLSSFPVHPGDVYQVSAVRDGLRALYRLELFEQIELLGDRTGDQVALTLRVREIPHVSAVEFAGNHEFSGDKLREKVTGLTGKVAGDKTRQELERTLEDFYRGEGYPLADVVSHYESGSRASERVLSVEIHEGARVQVTSIEFTGNVHARAEDLRGEMSTKQKSFWRKGHLREATLNEDFDKIKAWYQKHGYRDVKIAGHDVRYASDNRTAAVAIQIDEGALYTMGAVEVTGNKILTPPAVRDMIKFKTGDRYNRARIDESAGDIGAAYADRGYLYAQVDPEERLDGTTVNVIYRIEEQEPSKVREIRIVGNTRTKERVIRRQLYLFPGQRFDRALLIRSQRELFQLGFFQNVEVDFKPLPNSYDVDLVLNVEEKPVGTASAGAGFSSQDKLTGFVELSHPNLFGNGQSVSLRLERGGKTSLFELSFTEPWFLNTPTTVGADLFSTRLIRDLYEVKRTGGTLRFGRPVPGVPWTRMFGSYSFDRSEGLGRTEVPTGVDTTFFADNAIEKNRVAKTIQYDYFPGPVTFDDGKRNTSGITLGLTRNSTDHPIYPRAGSSTTLSWESNAKIFQGDVVFQKVLLDTKLFSSVLPQPKAMKPAWMLRGQIGAIDFFGRKDPLRAAAGDASDPEARDFRVEALELFRLGGTTRGQSLRGYSDYEVVPDDNIRVNRFITTQWDSLGTRTSGPDTTYSYQTFPGGRYYTVLTLERQFAIVEPLHGAFFAEAGGTWNDLKDFRFNSLHRSVGFGLRMEIPLLGLVGFDYAYGFDRLNQDRRDPTRGRRYDRGGWQGHLLFGRFF